MLADGAVGAEKIGRGRSSSPHTGGEMLAMHDPGVSGWGATYIPSPPRPARLGAGLRRACGVNEIIWGLRRAANSTGTILRAKASTTP